jgi:hypothetical protein
MSSISSIDHQKIQKSMNAIDNDGNQKSKTTGDQRTNRKRRNTIRIFMDATMHLISSPPTSPNPHCSSPSSITSNESNESSYFSFPEFEIYDEMKEVDNMVVQMERFDEMFVNGVRVPLRQI